MPWEIDALNQMERTYLSLLNSDEAAPVAEPLTPQSFRAMFGK